MRHRHKPCPLRDPVDSIPLDLAGLCENCSQITKAPDGRCKACGSVAVLRLSAVLNAPVAEAVCQS